MFLRRTYVQKIPITAMSTTSHATQTSHHHSTNTTNQALDCNILLYIMPPQQAPIAHTYPYEKSTLHKITEACMVISIIVAFVYLHYHLLKDVLFTGKDDEL